jgi:transforming growth factor-beta-induced protein
MGSDVMFGRTSLLKATALALPFSLAAVAAQAASVAETVQQNPQLGTFAKAIETAKFGEQLSGAGPFTVFAPTDQAFEQLPKGALDELMKQDNQEQLTKLLEHHIVQGKAMAADDLLGGQTKVDTMSGDSLTVDGTSQVVLLVPTGLTIAQVGDELVIEREGVAISRHAIEVEDAAVREAGGEQQAQGQQQAGAETAVAEGSDMPVTKHQEEVLKSTPTEEQRQTAPEGTAMPATEHQRQVLAEEELPGEQQQSYEQARVEGKPDILREATVIEPDIQADNGVIHVIDAVLVPQDVLKTLEAAKEGQG